MRKKIRHNNAYQARGDAAESASNVAGDLAKLLSALRDRRNTVAKERKTAGQEARAASQNWDSRLDREISTILPNLKRVTISNLEKKCPGFIDKSRLAIIEKTRGAEAPLFTRWFGNSERYVEDKLTQLCILLQTQLRGWISSQDPRPAFVKGADTFADKAIELSEKARKLAEEESRLDEQIKGLERAQMISRTGGILPQNFVSTVEASNKKLARLETNRRLETRDRDFDPLLDVYLPVIILNSILDQPSKHYRQDNDYWTGGTGGHQDTVPRDDLRRGGGSDSGVDLPTHKRDTSDRGGGIEITTDDTHGNTDRGGGVEVVLDSTDTDRGGGVEVEIDNTPRGDLS